MKTAQATLTGLLRGDKLHARIDDIKRAKGAPPWSEKIVVNDQIVSTLICQPPGHPNDRHYHLVDEWWLVVEGEIDWERSEERRVGKECRCRGWGDRERKKIVRGEVWCVWSERGLM